MLPETSKNYPEHVISRSLLDFARYSQQGNAKVALFEGGSEAVIAKSYAALYPNPNCAHKLFVISPDYEVGETASDVASKVNSLYLSPRTRELFSGDNLEELKKEEEFLHFEGYPYVMIAVGKIVGTGEASTRLYYPIAMGLDTAFDLIQKEARKQSIR